MSTPPTLVSIDAPPPVPPYASYPIATLQYQGYPMVQALPWDPTRTVQQQFNPNARMKGWIREQQPADNPDSYMGWNCIVNGVVIPNGVAMPVSEAAVANLAPIGMPQSVVDSLAGSVYYTQPEWPVPVRPLIATESIVQTVNGFQVVNSAVVAPPTPQTAQQATDSATLQRILAAEQEELAKDGLSPV